VSTSWNRPTQSGKKFDAPGVCANEARVDPRPHAAAHTGIASDKNCACDDRSREGSTPPTILPIDVALDLFCRYKVSKRTMGLPIIVPPRAGARTQPIPRQNFHGSRDTPTTHDNGKPAKLGLTRLSFCRPRKPSVDWVRWGARGDYGDSETVSSDREDSFWDRRRSGAPFANGLTWMCAERYELLLFGRFNAATRACRARFLISGRSANHRHDNDKRLSRASFFKWRHFESFQPMVEETLVLPASQIKGAALQLRTIRLLSNAEQPVEAISRSRNETLARRAVAASRRPFRIR